MSEWALEINGMTYSYPDFDLGPIDIRVPKGGMYAFLGPNGAGKTTTIELIMGMGRIKNGEVRVFGYDHIKDEVAAKLRIGYVSPMLNFNSWGTVKRLIAFLRAFYPDWDDAYCETLLKDFELNWSDSIRALSFGQKTRLALVTALSHRPQLLLLDEPQAGLDVVAKRQLFDALLEVVQDEERAVLISSHNLSEIERFADHIGIIHKGKMLVEGAADELGDRYRAVTCTLSNGGVPGNIPGITVQRHHDNRWNLVVDRDEDALTALKELGAEEISITPLSLEELFIALVKNNQN